MTLTKDDLKYGVGCVLARVLRERSALVQENFTLPYWHPGLANSRVNRLIRFAIARRMTTREPEQRLESIHREFWRSHSKDGWFSATDDRIEHRPAHVDAILAQLPELVSALGIRHVCEFGTGNGKFLQLLRERLGPELSYTGIDICVEQVEANRNVYTGLEFVAADACEWLDQNIRDNTLYLTFGGVLEYFCHTSVRQMLASIATCSRNSLLALFIEPIAAEHALESDPRSLSFGGEFSFSHNSTLFFLNQRACRCCTRSKHRIRTAT